MFSIFEYLFKIFAILAFVMMSFFSYKYYEIINDEDDVFNKRLEHQYSKEYNIPHQLTAEDVDSAIYSYIIKNPDVIIASLEKMQKEKSEARHAEKRDYINKNLDKIASTHFPSSGDGPVTVVFFYDYMCAHCTVADQILNEELANYKQGIKVIYRPLPLLGKNSRYLSEIMLALYKIRPDKFSDAHDKIMNAQELSIEYMNDLLKGYNIDYADIQKILDTRIVDRDIKDTYEIASQLKINGTPGFLIGDRVFLGVKDARKVHEAIESARKNLTESSIDKKE